MQNSVTKNLELDDIFEIYKLSEEESSKIQDTIHIGSTIDYICLLYTSDAADE